MIGVRNMREVGIELEINMFVKFHGFLGLLGMVGAALRNTAVPNITPPSTHNKRHRGIGTKERSRHQGPRRLETRTTGGNWQGKPYISYAEHDACTRAGFGINSSDKRKGAYRKKEREIISSR